MEFIVSGKRFDNYEEALIYERIVTGDLSNWFIEMRAAGFLKALEVTRADAECSDTWVILSHESISDVLRDAILRTYYESGDIELAEDVSGYLSDIVPMYSIRELSKEEYVDLNGSICSAKYCSRSIKGNSFVEMKFLKEGYNIKRLILFTPNPTIFRGLKEYTLGEELFEWIV